MKRVIEIISGLAGAVISFFVGLPPIIWILLAVMDQLGIGEIIVSEWGNLDGYLRRKLKEGKENG